MVGIEDSDSDEDIAWLSAKIVNLRVFEDENGVMNLSVKDVDGEVLVVSQFTLHAALKKVIAPAISGRRVLRWQFLSMRRL